MSGKRSGRHCGLQGARHEGVFVGRYCGGSGGGAGPTGGIPACVVSRVEEESYGVCATRSQKVIVRESGREGRGWEGVTGGMVRQVP